MEKKVTISDLIMKSVKQEVSAYDWQKQGTDTVKFGTNGTTWQGGMPSDSWSDN